MQFVCKTMQPRSARGNSKAIVARSAVGGARRAFKFDLTGSKTLAAWSIRHQMNGALEANFITNQCLTFYWWMNNRSSSSMHIVHLFTTTKLRPSTMVLHGLTIEVGSSTHPASSDAESPMLWCVPFRNLKARNWLPRLRTSCYIDNQNIHAI